MKRSITPSLLALFLSFTAPSLTLDIRTVPPGRKSSV